MDHKPAVSARTGRTDFERKSSLTKSIEKPENKSPLSERIKKHIEEIEQPKNQANMPQPANMLINKRVLPSRVKSRYFGLSWGCHRRFSVFRIDDDTLKSKDHPFEGGDFRKWVSSSFQWPKRRKRFGKNVKNANFAKSLAKIINCITSVVWRFWNFDSVKLGECKSMLVSSKLFSELFCFFWWLINFFMLIGVFSF